MKEYIERGELESILHNRYDRLAGLRPDFYAGYMMAFHTIEDDVPTAADVAPVVHGLWLCADTDTEQFFLCNRCKKKEYWESDYCPNCGAKMDGDEV